MIQHEGEDPDRYYERIADARVTFWGKPDRHAATVDRGVAGLRAELRDAVNAAAGYIEIEDSYLGDAVLTEDVGVMATLLDALTAVAVRHGARDV